MNTRRFFSAWLLAASLGLAASAQDNAELAALRAKAEKGNGIAQYNLGLAYTRGGDVPVDLAEAYTWLTLAQENGARGKALESLVATMDPPAVLAAQKRLAERRVQLGGPDPTGTPATATSLTDEGATRLRAERDALSVKLSELAGEIASLRAERDRLTKLVADHEKSAQSTAAELAAARNFAQQVESTLNKVNDQKAALEAQLRAAPAAGAVVANPAPASDDLKAASERIQKLETELAAANRQAEAATQTATDVSTQSAEDLKAARTRITEVLMQLEKAKSAAPAYPDLSDRVKQLETQLAAARRLSAPAYPDLSGRVRELEAQLADSQRTSAAPATETAPVPAPTPATASVEATTASADEIAALQKKLAETEDKLSIALRGYAFLQRQTDEKAATASKASDALAAERNDVVIRLADTDSRATAAQAEVTRLTEELAALRRATAKDTEELAATRAVLRQAQGANTTLAKENYQLKTRLAPTPAGSPTSPEPTPTTAGEPTVRTHTVIAGDSLSKIAQQYYGDAKRWPDLYQANRDKLGNEGTLRVGMELRVP